MLTTLLYSSIVVAQSPTMMWVTATWGGVLQKVRELQSSISFLELLLTDIHSATASPATTLRRSPSVLSAKSDADSASTVIASITRGSNLSPLQLLEVGKY